MAEHSTIEWTEATWSPITGCTLVSAGCAHCYAAELATTRLRNHPSRAGLARKNAAGEAKFTGEVRFNEQWLDQPLRWKRPRRIFVCAHSDLFHENVPDEWIDRVFAVMALAPQHTFQILTKRPERAREMLRAVCRPGLPERTLRHINALAANEGQAMAAICRPVTQLPFVWIGTSIEDQAAADTRIPALLAAPAAVRFLSAEPLLGPIDLKPWLHGISWVITGGESGRHARPSHPDWFRQIRDACAAAGTAYFHKQNGAWATVYDRDRDDPDWRRCNVVARDTPNGRWLNLAGGQGFHGDRLVRVVPVGKTAAGRLLDGREHNDMPEARA